MKFLLLILLISQLCFVSCSDLKKESIKKPELQHSSFEITCKLDMDALGNLLTKRVSGDIDCLESYLLLVANVLKSGKPRAIGKQEFKNLLSKGIEGLIEDVDPELIKALDAVFELNFLVGSGDREFITSEQISNLMDILKSFNEQIRPIYLDFSKNKKNNYQWHKNRREEHYKTVETMIKPILGIFNQKRTQIDQVDLLAILSTFSSQSSSKTIEMIRGFLIVKKIVLGGSAQKINHIELFQLLKKLPAITGVVYDLVKFPSIDFGEIVNYVDFFNIALRDFGRDILIGGKAGNQKLFSIRDLERYFKKLYKKPLDVDYFEASDFILNMKSIFFGEGRYFTGNQIRIFVNFLREMGHKFHYFLQMYDAHSDLLDRPRGMENLKFDRLVATNSTERNFQREFTEIFQKHLFFRKGSRPVVFTPKTIKTPRSIIEYAGYEMLAEKLMKYWERKLPCDGPGFTKKNGCKKENYQNDLNPEQLRTLIRLGADFLDKSGILTEDSIDSTVDSVTSLVDIFLQSSDGNRQVDKHELTEFITMVISSLQMYDDMLIRLKKTCSVNARNNTEMTCFKKEFFNEVFRTGDEIDYGEYFPLLKKYIQEASPQKIDLIMSDALKTVRPCQQYTNGEYVPVEDGSVYSILIVLMHIESLVIRFDQNNNNFLDINEVNNAFPLFDEEIAQELPDILGFRQWTSWKQKIIWYMLTKSKVPGTLKGFLLIFENKRKRERNIERADFVSLLKALAIDGKPKGFDSCEQPRVN